jgi:hypothetical protein
LAHYLHQKVESVVEVRLHLVCGWMVLCHDGILVLKLAKKDAKYVETICERGVVFDMNFSN